MDSQTKSVILFAAFNILLLSDLLSQKRVVTDTIQFGIENIIRLRKNDTTDRVIFIRLLELDKKDSKDYYNGIGSRKFRVSNKFIDYEQSKDSIWIRIPPLLPNRFFQVEVVAEKLPYLYSLFKRMSKESNPLILYENSKPWMQFLDSINIATDSQLVYQPGLSKINKFRKVQLKSDSSNICEVIDSFYSIFAVANFYYSKISINEILDLNKSIDSANIKCGHCPEITTVFWDYIGVFSDYDLVYQFYRTELQNYFTDSVNTDYDKFQYLKRKVDQYLNKPDTCSILHGFIVNSKEYMNNLSTYSFNFETNVSRTLIPDFGYVAYFGNNDLSGGSLFLGLNISLAPTNSNAPLALSKLTFGQRLSVHTGFVLQSLAKENVRKDFFKSNSLIVGLGYKTLTQGTRIISGGVFYQHIDQVTLKEKLAIQPYIGISIDIRIKKWIESIIPTFSNQF